MVINIWKATNLAIHYKNLILGHKMWLVSPFFAVSLTSSFIKNWLSFTEVSPKIKLGISSYLCALAFSEVKESILKQTTTCILSIIIDDVDSTDIGKLII